ncbi:hypothetical protein ACFX1Q_026403 [Malus domestica]
MEKKLQGWRGGLLSSAGKELLVKTMAQALPMYTMQCFLLPKSFCEELNMMIAKFWWSGEPGKRKIHWVNWLTLSKSKEEGGLGFRDLYAFNIALLAKQAWRFIMQPHLLAFTFFKARYFPSINFLNAPVKTNTSFVWRSVAATHPVISKGLRWQVGDGSCIKIWGDNWLPRENYFKVFTPPPLPLLLEATVESLFLDGTRTWNKNMLH